MAYRIICDRTRECKRKIHYLVATFRKPNLRQLIDAVGIDLFQDLELRSNTWLSPLHCYSAQAAVNFKSGTPRDLVSEMSEQKFVVIATERTGWAVVKYEFRDVDLQQFEVKRVRP